MNTSAAPGRLAGIRLKWVSLELSLMALTLKTRLSWVIYRNFALAIMFVLAKSNFGNIATLIRSGNMCIPTCIVCLTYYQNFATPFGNASLTTVFRHRALSSR